MKNPVEATLTILMMLLVLEIVSDSSIACIQHGDNTCSVHTLTCKDGNVIWILDAMFGFRRSCSSYKTPKYRNCSSSCCHYLETDCFVEFSRAELREVNSDCSRKEKCTFTKFIFHILQNSLECQDKDILVNAYSKIDYVCLTRFDYDALLSKSIWPWTKSTSKRPISLSSEQPSSMIHRPITSTAITVPSFSLNDSSHTVSVTTAKSLTDHQYKKQPPDTGAVIGGILSGVILIVILVVIGVYCVKRRIMNPKQASKRQAPIENTTNTMIGNVRQDGDNSKSEYENESTPSVNDVYSRLEAKRLPTIYSSLENEIRT